MTEYFEIFIPLKRGRTSIYGRKTLPEAIAFAKDALSTGWKDVNIYHVTTVDGRTGKERILPASWKETA